MTAVRSKSELLELVVGIVSAHVSHNAVTPEALPAVIRSVHATLGRLTAAPPLAAAPRPAERPDPAVPIKRSVFADYIVCLEDGKKLKMLKRHLSVSFGLTPAAYRARWGLAPDYPMVAPSYAARRSASAQTAGLGRKQAAAGMPDTPPIRRVAEGVRGVRAARKPTGA